MLVFRKISWLIFCSILLCAAPLAHAENRSFLSVSDLHFDPFYTCSVMQPCALINKLETAPASEWPTILATEATTPPQYNHDTSYVLLQSALKAIDQTIVEQHPQFMLVLGDLLAHHFEDKYKTYSLIKTDEGYAEFVKKTMVFLTHELVAHTHHTALYMAVGNNDSYKGDYIVDPDGSFFVDMAKLWSPLVNDKNNSVLMSEAFSHAGYYALTLPQQPSVRLIVLNTNLFSRSAQVAPEEALKEFTWFEQELADAVANQQQVLLAMHIPAGIDVYASLQLKPFQTVEFWQHDFTERFAADIKTYADHIMGILPAHVHSDGFEVLALTATSKIPVVATPSISPNNGNNPAFKLLRYDTTQLVLQDFITYYTTLSDLTWQTEYDFNTVYQPNCVTCKVTDGMQLLQAQGSLAVSYQLYFDAQSNTDLIHQYYDPYYWCQVGNMTASNYQACLQTVARKSFAVLQGKS